MDIGIIIVSWNVRERVRTCLASIRHALDASTLASAVVVVDNASDDGTSAMIREEFPWVQVIANGENRGFAAANNQGIHALQSIALPPEFILLLNPDMEVQDQTLDGIVRFMREACHARVGIAGCRLLDEHGSTVPQLRRFPTVWDQLAILLKVSRVFPWVVHRYLMRDADDACAQDVDSIRGAFFCIRRTMMDEIGLLDEGYFLWFEEVDYCMRAHRAGWRVTYTPDVTCIDYVGQSFRQVRLFPKQRQFSKSMMRYLRTYRPWWEWVVIACVRPWVLAAAWIVDRWYA